MRTPAANPKAGHTNARPARSVTIGTAGWAIPPASAVQFPLEGFGLTRYGAKFSGVEINATFYRRPRPQTLDRWRASTPDGFRFALKAPKAITHGARLVGCGVLLTDFFTDIAPLDEKLGPVLVQLPPSLAFDARIADDFLDALRNCFSGAVAMEPRHPSWFQADVEALLRRHRVARVAADPPCVNEAKVPGGNPHLAYWRLHGSPRTYYSAYAPADLSTLRDSIALSAAQETWCIFDNTASGAAIANALSLQADLVPTSSLPVDLARSDDSGG